MVEVSSLAKGASGLNEQQEVVIEAIDDGKKDEAIDDGTKDEGKSTTNPTLESSSTSASIRQRKQQPPKLQSPVQFEDHFTLRRPSCNIIFKGECYHTYDLRNSQVQIKISPQMQPEQQQHEQHPNVAGTGTDEGMVPEESKPKNGSRTNGNSGLPPFRLELKDAYHERSEYLSLLRLTYTIVALFCMATFFSFSFMVIVLLFMKLVHDAGLTLDSVWQEVSVQISFFGTLFAIPVFLYGFSSLLTVWTFFISETWHGFPWLRTIATDLDEVLIEWVTMVMMLGVPMVTLVISLFRAMDEWWETTIYVWYISVTIFFTFFTIVVVYCESEAAWLIIYRNADESIRQSSGWSKFKYFVGHAIKLTQEKHYSGYMDKIQVTGVSSGSGDQEDEGKLFKPTRKFWRRLYTKITQWGCLSSVYEKIDPPQRVISVNDIILNRRFATRDNWALEKFLCSSSAAQHVVVVKGPNALKKSQIISTVACTSLSILGLIMVIFGFLSWLDLSVGSFVVFAILIGLMCSPKITTMWRFLNVYKKMRDEQEEEHGEGPMDCGNVDHYVSEEGVYQKFETFRVSRPTRRLRHVFFALHKGFLYLFPIGTLIWLENYPVLVLFVIVAIWSCFRFWFDPVNMLHFHGNLHSVGRTRNTLPFHEWKDRSRISAILLNVTRAHGTKAFIKTFLLFILAIFTLTVGSLGYQRGFVGDRPYVPLPLTPRGDFVYHPQPNLKYPTCSLVNNANFLNNTETTLIDYILISRMMYQQPKSFQGTLDEWFGPNVTRVDFKTTREYRNTLTDVAVAYEIISFGDTRSVVAVRGSNTAWEFLTDAQMWAAVTMMQFFLSFLPVGNVFHPILDEVLDSFGIVISKDLKEIQLDQQTSGLIEYMRNSGDYDHPISITGHSLGGGISLITGAHTKIPAIALSGPNTFFSRSQYDPKLDEEVIDTWLFNIIPERDPVPMVDRPGLQNQKIACHAAANNFKDCHNPVRSMCELMVTCGSYNRPPPCDCVTKFGYDPPQQVSGNRSFIDICGNVTSNDGGSDQVQF